MSRRFNLRRLTALVLALMCLLVMTVQAEEAEPASEARNPQIPAEYQLVAQSSRFNLYLYEPVLSIIVESRANGKLLFSTVMNDEELSSEKKVERSVNFYKSGVTLEYIKDIQPSLEQINPYGSEDCQITYDYREDGFTAHVSYPSIGISHDLILTMDDAGLHVNVPLDSIVENLDQPYVVMRTAEGEERVDIKRYETVSSETEYVFITADGAEYIVDASAAPKAKGKTQVNVNVSDTTVQALPLTVRTVALSTDAGEIEIPHYRVVIKTQADGTYKLVTDGAEYVLPADYIGSVKNDGTVLVKMSDGKSMALPLDKELAPTPTVAVVDAEGRAAALAMDQVVGFRTNTYAVGKLPDGSAFRFLETDILEKHYNSYTAAGLYIFPLLGYSYMGGNEGYMIIPDGQGALIELKNNITDEKKNTGLYGNYFSRTVYGDNISEKDAYRDEYTVPVEPIVMPIFGMVHTDDQIGYLSVLEEGDVGATIYAYMNGTNKSRFDYACANFNFRYVFSQPMGPVSSPDYTAGAVKTRTEHRRSMDIVQHFLLEDGASATYAGLAVAYREYLTEKGVFANASDRPFDVQLDFVGLERENYIFGKQDVVMTSYEETLDIISELNENGVDEMSVVLRGWQAGGLTGGVPVEGYDPAGSLGGKSGLEALREYCEAQGIDFALEVDVLSLNVETHPTLTYSSYEHITSKTFERPTYGKVYSTLRYLTPSMSARKAAEVVDEMEQGGLTGISLTGITQHMSDYAYKDQYYDSAQLAEIYTGIVRDAGEKMTVTLSSPNAYLWPEANVLSDLPIGGSDHNYTAAEIPFLAIALSGRIPFYAEYVNFQANTNAFFLHLVEQGARPAFLLTWEDPIELQNTNSSSIYSSRYELYADMIVEWYSELCGLYAVVSEAGEITAHEREGDMVRVTWNDETQVYINFGHREATMDGVTVAPRGTQALVDENGEPITDENGVQVTVWNSGWTIGQEVSADGN